MTDAHEAMWADAATDHVASLNLRTYTLAKVAAQEAAWSFLAASKSPAEYDARLDLVNDRVEAAVAVISADDTALLDQVKTSLREDHQMLLMARAAEIATDWADDSGPLCLLATTGEVAEGIWTEIGSVVAMTVDPADRRELAELVTALGGSPNFPIEGAAFPTMHRHPNSGGHAAFPAEGETPLEEPDAIDHKIDELNHREEELPSPWKHPFEHMRDQHHINDEDRVLQKQMQPAMASKLAAFWDPEGEAEAYDEPEAYKAGWAHGHHGDDSQAEQYAAHPTYGHGLSDGEMAAVEEKTNPNAYAVKTAEYQYIRQHDGRYEVFQKGTGKTLSTHDTKEDAEASFRAMMQSKHSGAVWGCMVEGVFHPVAVNESAQGSERYQHTPVPPKPAWINDEYADHEVVDYGQNPMKNNADGDELKATAPWLVQREGQSYNTATGSTTITTNTTLPGWLWQSPPIVAEYGNPFTVDGPGNPGSPQSPVAPGGMPINTNPDASVQDALPDAGMDPNGSGMTTMPDSAVSPLADAPAAGVGAAPMPSPADDQTMNTPPSTPSSATSALYTQPVDSPVDKIAAKVLATNPGITVSQALAMAQRTLDRHPEMAAA